MSIITTYQTLDEKKNFYKEHDLFIIKTKDEFDRLYSQINKNNSSIWRGSGNASHKLYNSLQKFWIENDLKSSNLNPSDYLQKIIKEARSWNDNLLEQYFKGLGLGGKLYDMAILSILRHYGSPVPFLDFTKDPRIALFFSCDNYAEKGGTTDIENNFSLYEITDQHSIRGGNYKLTYKEYVLHEFIERFKVKPSKSKFEVFLNEGLIYEILNHYFKDESDTVLIADDNESDKYLYYIKSSLNISKQKGLFVLSFTTEKPLEQSIIDNINSPILDRIRKYLPFMTAEEEERRRNESRINHSENFLCYNIHKSLKEYILKKLNIDGINKVHIYPDLNSLASNVVDSFLRELNYEKPPMQPEYIHDSIYSRITLTNPVKPEIKPITVKCLADTGSTYMVIPQHIAAQLQLTSLETREATAADGSSHTVPYAGPVRVTFENRNCFVGALIMGDEVLLGAVPMEDMDLVVLPKLLKLSVNPESPNIARGHVK